MRSSHLIAAVLFAVAGLAGSPACAASPEGLAIHDPGLKASKTLNVSSPKIAADGAIPDAYSAYGQGTSPPLAWSKGPYGARAFALIVEDPDAPMPTPFVHWVVWNIPAGTTSIAEGQAPAGARQGKLMFVNKVGYMGPRPPPGGPHHYHFQVFALHNPLDLPDGADRNAVVAAMKGQVLASGELVATYQKK